MISDSMTRGIDMRSSSAHLSMNPGASVNRIADMVLKHQIRLKGFRKILVAVGVIDILDIFESKDSSYQNIEFRQLMNRFVFLLRVIRRKNPTALILVSGILPVPKYHSDIGLKIRSVNFALHVISAKFGNAIYIDSPSAFLSHLNPIKNYFKDGLHLNASGTSVFSSRLRQAVSTLEIARAKAAKKNVLMESYPVDFFN